MTQVDTPFLGTGGTIPSFADETNKKLDADIQVKEEQLKQLEKQTDEMNGRLALMKQHILNLESEIGNSQMLLEAKTHDKQTGEHLAQLSSREAGKIKLMIETKKKEIIKVQEEYRTLLSQGVRVKEGLAVFRQQMNWGQEQLNDWVEEERLKEEDYLALQKYSRADETKILELSQAIEKLAKEKLAKERYLEEQLVETKSRQIELDKTAEIFKALHSERQHLISQWEESISSLAKRDQEIEQAREHVQKLEGVVSEREVMIKTRQKFFDSEEAANHQLEAKIDAADRSLIKRRNVYGHSHQGIIVYEDELDSLRNTLIKTVTTCDERKAEISSLYEEIEAKKKRIETAKENLISTKQKLENEFAVSNDLTVRARQMESFVKQEEHRLKLAEKEVEELKQQVFKQSQDLYNLRQKEQNYQVQINGARAADRNLQAKIHKLDSESMKQQELLYNQEFQLQQLERKIARIQGERTSQEKAILNQKIGELTDQLEEEQGKYTLIVTQNKKIQDDVRAVKRRAIELKENKNKMENVIQELILENESTAASLKTLTQTKEDIMMQENSIRLDVKRLRDILYKKTDTVFSLENQRHQVQLDFEERKHNLLMEKDVLKARLMALEEDKHRSVKEMKDLMSHIDRLKKKYELLLFKTSTEEDSDEHSQSYFVIKAALEKEELKRSATNLSKQIEVGQKEVDGLNNTLTALNLQNQKMHMEKNRLGVSEAEFEECLNLEQTFNQLRIQVEEKMAQITEIGERLDAEDEQHRNAEVENMRLQEEFAARDLQIENKIYQIQDLESKIERANKLLLKFKRDLQKKLGLPASKKTVIDLDVEYQTLKDNLFVVLYSLGQLRALSPELGDAISSTAEKYGIDFPESMPVPQIPVNSSTSRSNTAGLSRGLTSSRGSVTSRGNVVTPGLFDNNSKNKPPRPPSSSFRPPSGGAKRLPSATKRPPSGAKVKKVPKLGLNGKQI